MPDPLLGLLSSLVQQKTDHLLDGLVTALTVMVPGEAFQTFRFSAKLSSRKVEPAKCSSQRKVNTWFIQLSVVSLKK